MTFREMWNWLYAGFGSSTTGGYSGGEGGHPHQCPQYEPSLEPGTMIVKSREAKAGGVVGIASDDGFCNIFIDKYMMNREVGFGRKLLQILEEEGVSYAHAVRNR